MCVCSCICTSINFIVIKHLPLVDRQDIVSCIYWLSNNSSMHAISICIGMDNNHIFKQQLDVVQPQLNTAAFLGLV